MNVNPFEGVFSAASSSNQLPVKVLVDKIEKKERKEPKKLSKPNDEPDDQPEQTKGRSSSKSKRLANTPPPGRPEPKRKPNKSSDDDDVEMAGITLNTNGDMKYWKSQSPNELRAQLKLRNIPINRYAFLKKRTYRFCS